ncbi:MAG: 2,3-bisphosphoglycerate-independent phosphoglycerate mutase [Candidatus Moraniibacteriota bacterium]
MTTHIARPKPVILIVLDGYGYREDSNHNAVAQAETPFIDHLWATCPHTLIDASEEGVGLPTGQMGNSEIGHMTIGAGRRLDTDIVRIALAIRNNEFATNPAFVQLFDHIKKYDSVLHIKGLLSPGGVHSHTDHLYAFLSAAKDAGITKIAIHIYTDGRDTGPKSAAGYIKELEDVIDDLGIGFIATASGRFYAMDRDNNWDRIARAERVMFEGEGTRTISNQKASAVMENLYAEDIVDEHLEPVVFLDEDGKSYTIGENDGLFFFNFRADRARQISTKVVEYTQKRNICFVTLTEYDTNLPALVAFPPLALQTTLAQEISRAGLTQAHIAETEKYAHATYFLNGGQELPNPGEEHILVESRKDILTHDQAPEMRAREIADKALEVIEVGTDFLFINFANADMVGHTGNVPALIIALETLDRELKRVVEAATAQGGCVFITADHGNAETNVDEATHEIHTAHTLNKVPGILATADPTLLAQTLHEGTLVDITPTILALLHIPQPDSMTGQNLLQA